MVEQREDIDLVFEDVGVLDEAFIDDLHAAFGVGRLFEGCLVDGAIATSADGLANGRGTL